MASDTPITLRFRSDACLTFNITGNFSERSANTVSLGPTK